MLVPGRDVSLVRCRRCRATLICGPSDRATAGRLPEISLRRLTAKPPKFIYALIASHSPLSHSHACNAAESRFRFIASHSSDSSLSLLTVQVLSFTVLSREDATSPRDGEADDSEIQDARYATAALPSLTLTAAETRESRTLP